MGDFFVVVVTPLNLGQGHIFLERPDNQLTYKRFLRLLVTSTIYGVGSIKITTSCLHRKCTFIISHSQEGGEKLTVKFSPPEPTTPYQNRLSTTTIPTRVAKQQQQNPTRTTSIPNKNPKSSQTKNTTRPAPKNDQTNALFSPTVSPHHHPPSSF